MKTGMQIILVLPVNNRVKLMNNNTSAFFALLRAGLWEKDVNLLPFGDIDYKEVFRLAEEQSVVGLVAAGLEHVTDVKVPKDDVLQFVGCTLQIEERNRSMNSFLGKTVDSMRKADIYALLVKGQGIAQCYAKPLWRACGDIDFLLSDTNLTKAKDYLIPLASKVEEEDSYEQHQGLVIDSWLIELHGNLHTGISRRIDKVLDIVQADVFYGGHVRSWIDNGTHVFLPGENCDVIFIFTHILKHFFIGGIGLRQICDWCRFLWTYRKKIDIDMLEKKILLMRIMTEWKAFATLAVQVLGMEEGSMPFYSDSSHWKRKSQSVLSVILKTGNMGHNRDLSYQKQYGSVRRKIKTFGILSNNTARNFTIFPLDSFRAWWNLTIKGVKNVI